jgi:phosphatidate phosphatase APP1
MTRSLLAFALLLPLLAHADGNKVVLYDGYGSSERFVIEGRVIEAEKPSAPDSEDSWWRNLWRNFRLMKNSEREDVALKVKVGSFEAGATTDEEGYFRVTATQTMAPGWHTVVAQGKRAQGQGRLLIVPRTNALGLISDIDDTVMVSEVPDKKKLLGNTFLKNPQQRQAFPGTADFYKRLLAQNADPKAAPMFYLSASPRQLAGNIDAFLTRNNFPTGVLLTKQISGENRDPLRDQKQYKMAKIEALFTALPWVRFVLVGDDGELDPETYQAIREMYPERVAAIYIRKVSTNPERISYPEQLDLGLAAEK